MIILIKNKVILNQIKHNLIKKQINYIHKIHTLSVSTAKKQSVERFKLTNFLLQHPEIIVRFLDPCISRITFFRVKIGNKFSDLYAKIYGNLLINIVHDVLFYNDSSITTILTLYLD